MVQADQPTCFPPSVTVAVSSKSDRTMLDRGRSFHHAPAVNNRTEFCKQVGLRYDACVFQLVQYNDAQTYAHMAEVTSLDATKYTAEIAGDGLFTAERGVGLFLPVADCIATVIYDPIKHYLALLHLGRHATCADFATYAITYFTERGSRSKDCIVWMSPSAKKETYYVDQFAYDRVPGWHDFYEQRDGRYYLDLTGYNRRSFIESGVQPENIHTSHVNTMTDPDYFSHRDGDVSGRIAVVAMIR